MQHFAFFEKTLPGAEQGDAPHAEPQARQTSGQSGPIDRDSALASGQANGAGAAGPGQLQPSEVNITSASPG